MSTPETMAVPEIPAPVSAPPKPAETGSYTVEILKRDIPATLAERRELAELHYRSPVIPGHLRSVAAQMTCHAAALALRVPLWDVWQNLYLVEGKAAWSAHFMRSRVISAGHKFRVMTRTRERAVVRIIRSDDPEPYVVEYEWEDAVRAELTEKKPWKKYPKDMMVARATAIAVRDHCPEVMGGVVYTPEELGAADVDDEGRVVAVESERVVVDEVTHDDAKARARARWQEMVADVADLADVARLRALATESNVLGSILYPADETTVGEQLDALEVELSWESGDQRSCAADADADDVQDAEVIDVHPIANGDSESFPGDVPKPDAITETSDDGETAPVPDPPARCRMTNARKGVLNALRDGGDVDALVQVEYGLPVEQVSTSRLLDLATRIRPERVR